MEAKDRARFAGSREWRWLKQELQEEMARKINQLASGTAKDMAEYSGFVAAIKTLRRVIRVVEEPPKEEKA